MQSWSLIGSITVLLAMAFPFHAIGADARGSAYDHEFQSIEGPNLPLRQYEGLVLLIVNTASFCGFTHQYQGLQKLWDTYKDKGLVVIGVPSNDFGAQEPKAEGEIKDFCQGAFGITFPLTAKYPVSGQAAHPFYKWIATTLGAQGAPRWNFHKILIDRNGQPVAAYRSTIEPLSAELTTAIEAQLTKK